MTGATVHIPEPETARLIMRAPDLSDYDAYAAFLVSDRSRTIGGPFRQGETFMWLAALIGQWHLRGFGRRMVTDMANGAGKGIAHEAALAARTYAYDEMGWPDAVSLIDPTNTRSVALARRFGCEMAGRHPAPEAA